jgi:hypothetical protein
VWRRGKLAASGGPGDLSRLVGLRRGAFSGWVGVCGLQGRGDAGADERRIESAQAKGGAAVDDVVYGHGPFVRDRVVDLRPEVGGFGRYPFEGILVGTCIGEEVLCLSAVEVEEVIHGRSVEAGRENPGGGSIRTGEGFVAEGEPSGADFGREVPERVEGYLAVRG